MDKQEPDTPHQRSPDFKWKRAKSDKFWVASVFIILGIYCAGIIVGIVFWEVLLADYPITFITLVIVLILLGYQIIRGILQYLQVRISRMYVVYRGKKYYIQQQMLLMMPTVKITSLQEIEGLATFASSIKRLILPNNQLQNLQELAIFTELESLNLANNGLTSLQGFPKLPKLKVLNLRFNELRDIAPLASLGHLEALSASENFIEDLAGFGDCPNLTHLYLSKNFLTRISGLYECPKLIELHLEENQLISLEGVKGLYSLESLYVSRNKLARISGLETLLHLKYFVWLRNPIPKGIKHPPSGRGQPWVKYCQLARGPAVIGDLQAFLKERELIPPLPPATDSDTSYAKVTQKLLQKQVRERDLQFARSWVEKRIKSLTIAFHRPDYNPSQYIRGFEHVRRLTLREYGARYATRAQFNMRHNRYKLLCVACVAVGQFWLLYLFATIGSFSSSYMTAPWLLLLFTSILLVILLFLLQHLPRKQVTQPCS